MIGAVYDYLAAVIIVGSIFVAAVVVVPNASYMNLLYVDQQQLRNVALETLKTMLLDAGYPENWGSQTPFDQNSVQRFGLAHSSTSSFYVLDSEKVQRLVVSNPAGHIDYEVIREKLGLQDYGFCIKIFPLFNVTVNDLSQGNDLLFDINVRFNDGRAIPNAAVDATLLYVELIGKKENFNFTTPFGNSTDELGKCTIGCHVPDLRGYILVLKVTVADMATVTIPYLEGFAQNVAHASIIGDTVTLSIPEDLKNPPERVVLNMTGVSVDGVVTYSDVGGELPEDQLTHGAGYAYWSEQLAGLRYDDLLFLVFDIWTQEDPPGGAKHHVLFAVSPIINIKSGLLQVGSSSGQSSGGTIKVSRAVDIRGMTHIFELLMWKEL